MIGATMIGATMIGACMIGATMIECAMHWLHDMHTLYDCCARHDWCVPWYTPIMARTTIMVVRTRHIVRLPDDAFGDNRASIRRLDWKAPIVCGLREEGAENSKHIVNSQGWPRIRKLAQQFNWKSLLEY
jgi:hypothetical protein